MMASSAPDIIIGELPNPATMGLSVGAAPGGSSSAAGLLSGYSVGVTVRSRHVVGECLEHLTPGTAVYIAAVPGDDPRQSVDLAGRLRAAGFLPVPHIAARSIESLVALDEHLAELAQVGVTRALIVAGDLVRPCGPFETGLDLLRTGLFQRHQVVNVGLPWYLEGHPIMSELDIRSTLMEKIRYIREHGLQGWLLSQICFSAAPYAARARQVRAMGIDLPLVAGIAGPCDRKTLIKFAERCRIGNSIRLLSQHCHQTGRLIDAGAPERLLTEITMMQRDCPAKFAGVHVFNFGGVPVTADWARDILGTRNLSA